MSKYEHEIFNEIINSQIEEVQSKGIILDIQTEPYTAPIITIKFPIEYSSKIYNNLKAHTIESLRITTVNLAKSSGIQANYNIKELTCISKDPYEFEMNAYLVCIYPFVKILIN